MTVLLIGATCVFMNVLIGYSGRHYMDSIGSYITGYGDTDRGEPEYFDPEQKKIDEELTIVVHGAQESFITTNWYITAAVTILGGVLAYFLSGHALKPLRTFASQVEKVQLNNLTDMKINEDVLPEFRQFSRSFNQMLERLDEGFTAQRQFTGNAAHELRTPLASIRSLADALNDGMVQDEKDRKRYYGYILRESIRLSNLINDLLELSRLQSGGVAFSKGRVELYEIAYDVADRMNDAAAQRGKSVRLEAPEGEYYAYTNADRIEQVLIALVDNAIKHGTDGCTVSVNLFENAEKNRYEFVVSNPAEVDPADLEHLFERFYKADHAHTGDGTGLGLAIVSEVLNLLGEKIDIEYENGIIAFRFTAEKCSTPKKHRALQKAENKNEDGEPTA